MRRDDPARGAVTREEFQQERWFMRRAVLASIALAFGFALGAFLAIFMIQRQGFHERARISDEFCGTVQGLVAAQIPRDERVAFLLSDSPSPQGRQVGLLFEASANFGRRFVAADCDHLPADLRIPKLAQQQARTRASTTPSIPPQAPSPSSTTTGAVPAPPPKPRPRKQAPSKTAPVPVPTPAPTPSPPEATPAPGPIPNPVVPSVPAPVPPPPIIRLPCLRLPQLPPIGECA